MLDTRLRLASIASGVAFGALPLVALAVSLATFSDQGRLALDFHEELYPQAEAVARWENPFAVPGTPISDTTNAVWPIAAVLPAVPMTLLSPRAADWLATFLMLATLPLALWIFEVRDWRIYGVLLLWPPVIDAYQTANITLPLALLAGFAWRYRERTNVAGIALGFALAVKFFLWPVIIWFVAIGRVRTATTAVAIALASLVLLLPFTSIADYARLVRDLSDTFDGFSYTLFALLVDVGSPELAARAATLGLGASVLMLAWRRRSLGLAVGAALILSPIVWRHFFALLLVPLAIARPRFDAVWLIPLGFWFVPGTLNGEPWQTGLGLALAAVTLTATEIAPRGTVDRGIRLRAPKSLPGSP